MTVAAALGLGSIGSAANAIEEPRYTVIQQLEGIEVRNYATYLVAEVVVPGPALVGVAANLRLALGRSRSRGSLPRAPAPD